MAKHERPAKSDEWYTPPHVFRALGAQFDLDVAHPPGPSLTPALRYLSQGSLEAEWRGFVWCNPPFGGRNGIAPWLEKFMSHGNGVALTPDRTSCPWWQTYAPQADLVLFAAPKIHFIPGPGARSSSPAQGTTLFARGDRGVAALERAHARGLGRIGTLR
jgi:hypothetical protein